MPAKKVSFIIDGKEADYNLVKGLPFSLKKSTDQVFKLPGTGGVEVDNPASRLLFPGSFRNQEIFKRAQIVPANQPGTGEALSAIVVLNGSQIVNGSALLHSVNIKDQEVQGYSAGVRGGVNDLFKELDGVLLTELDLGSVVWTEANQRASWIESLDTVLAIWAPVYYGNPNKSTYTSGPISHNTKDLRPHIPFKRIIEAIEKTLGFDIVSTFFDTEFFKRHIYLYGIGETSVTEDYAFNVAITDWSPAGLQSPIIGTYSETDPFNVFDLNNRRFVAPVNGTYTFSLDLEIKPQNQPPNPITYQLIASNGQSVSTSASLVPFLSFGPVQLLANEWVELRADEPPGGAGPYEDPIILQGSLIEPSNVNSTVSLASTLHAEPVLEFLRGISHQFNLAWSVDLATRRIIVEPRFSYVLDGTRYDGFYKSLASAKQIDDRVDKSKVSLNIERPFGDWITFKNKDEDSSLHKRARQLQSGNIPFMGARYNFQSATGIKGTPSENPFFEDLLLAGTNIPGNLYMPLIMPEHEYGEPETEEEPTFSSEPKYGFYAGLINYASWFYNGSPESVRPVVYQKPYPFGAGNSDIKYTASYGDYVVSGKRLPGYVSLFYPQYLANVDNAVVVEAPYNIRLYEFAGEDFRSARILSVGKGVNPQPFILTEINSFNPLGRGLPNGVFWKIAPLFESIFTNIQSNSQTWYINL